MKPDFNKQKLIPAIIQDYKTKEVLMLAYVNEESYNYMLENKETCFFSRSRQKIWHKGETSGNFQKIKKMYLDCDKDTLLILVEQIGVACHTGEYSCFFNEVLNYSVEDIEKNDMILQDIYNRIDDRNKNPKENSYTNYLLNEGTDKICKKIGEEASETIIAAKNDNKYDLIGEIGDLVYHVLVLMYDRKIKLDDVKAKLTERHSVQGNKKIQNKRGDY